jgi:hypothetical protein
LSFDSRHLLVDARKRVWLELHQGGNVFLPILFEAFPVHRIFHQPDSDGNLKLLEPPPAKLSELAMELSRVVGLPESNRGAHDLAHDGIFFAIDCHLCDFRISCTTLSTWAG